jgi:hypothetical protein
VSAPSRRWVLQSVCASGASLVLTFAGCGGGRYRAEIAGLEGLVDGDLAAAVGERYVARHPEEADRDKLVEALLGGPVDEQGLAELPARIAAAVRRDFETGEVVTLRHWRLSRTEGRLCALVSLGRWW